MKNRTTAAVFAAAIAATALVSVAASAQGVAPDVLNRATEACTRQAEAKGFKLQNVTENSMVDADTLKVVLNLARVDNSGTARLTCRYSTSKNSAVLGDDSSAPADTRTYTPLIPWWLGILLPLLGLAGLWALTRGRDDDRVVHRDYDRTTYRGEAIVRTDGNLLNVHAGPALTQRVTGSLQNGQRVNLTGRVEDGWAELQTGGWVPVSQLDVAARYAH